MPACSVSRSVDLRDSPCRTYRVYFQCTLTLGNTLGFYHVYVARFGCHQSPHYRLRNAILLRKFHRDFERFHRTWPAVSDHQQTFVDFSDLLGGRRGVDDHLLVLDLDEHAGNSHRHVTGIYDPQSNSRFNNRSRFHG